MPIDFLPDFRRERNSSGVTTESLWCIPNFESVLVRGCIVGNVAASTLRIPGQRVSCIFPGDSLFGNPLVTLRWILIWVCSAERGWDAELQCRTERCSVHSGL
jgi:hypothetical protein